MGWAHIHHSVGFISRIEVVAGQGTVAVHAGPGILIDCKTMKASSGGRHVVHVAVDLNIAAPAELPENEDARWRGGRVVRVRLHLAVSVASLVGDRDLQVVNTWVNAQ